MLEERAQPLGDRLHVVVFQKMDESAQRTFVPAESHRFLESRRNKFAGPAEFGITRSFIDKAIGGRELGYPEIFSATSTKFTLLWLEGFPAGFADGNPAQTI